MTPTNNETQEGRTMKFQINSRKLDKIITFSRPGSSYVFIDLNGNPGTLGNQICDGGCLSGSTVTFSGEDQRGFEKVCRLWWRTYIKGLEV